MFELDKEKTAWLDSLREKGQFSNEQLAELESHLDESMEQLQAAGLNREEAFIIGLKRLGDSELLSSEYAKVNEGPLWKKLSLYDTESEPQKKTGRDILLLLLLSLIAGTLAKLPQWIGAINSMQYFTAIETASFFKNIGLYFIPCVTVYFFIRQGWVRVKSIIVGSIFLVSMVVLNLFPMHYPYHTTLLSAIHLSLFLWLVAGSVYGGNKWRESRIRMDFIRHSGETFIYGTLLFCGVMVFTLFSVTVFKQINLNIESWFVDNILIYLIFAIPIVSVYLVDAKKSIVENIAPILARIFSPLFLVIMLIFLGAVIFFQADPFSNREFLIIYNLMLILVLGLVLYVISARKPGVRANVFDWMNLVLIGLACTIDVIVLSAIIFRISSFGWTPNRTAALGINLLLLANLMGLAVNYLGFFLKKREFEVIERWQTFYLYLYAGWCGVVAFVFPVLFGFV